MNIVKWQRPTLTTWPSFGRLFDLRDEIDRLFESPLSELTRTSQLLSGWTPALDVYEGKDNFVVKAELPGMKKEDVTVQVRDGHLELSGERKQEKEEKADNFYRIEREYGRFYRAVPLPKGVKLEDVKATFADGVLEVSVPLPAKPEAAARKVEIEEPKPATKSAA
jgi:HSP20 family protein